jgi:hypothetical protein
MAKYRKASEKTIKSGKGISTDNLSFEEAKAYFNQRAKETGAKRFRHNGQVYDLSGNKVSETPARSSGGGSRSSSSEGTNRPRANPTRSPGGARPEPGKASGMPAARKPESPGKRGEVNPGVVAAMGAAGVAAGVAASRSGRKPPKAAGSNSPTPKPPAKPAATTSKPATTPSKPKAGGARVGGAPVGGALRRGPGGKGVLKMPDVLSLQFMNKGGMVKKK